MTCHTKNMDIMKRLSVFLTLLLAVSTTMSTTVSAQPRLSVNVRDAGAPSIWCINQATLAEGAEPDYSYDSQREGVGEFDIPDDGNTYFVVVEFAGRKSGLQSIHLVILPGEKIRVVGEMHENYIDYDVEGSEAFGALAKHRRRTYMRYEAEIAEKGIHPCDGDECDIDGGSEQYKELSAKINRARYKFIERHPNHQLSAIYYGCAPLGTDRSKEVYDMLSDKVKNGPYKVFVESYRKLFEY